MPTPETLAKNAEREARKSQDNPLWQANKRAGLDGIHNTMAPVNEAAKAKLKPIGDAATSWMASKGWKWIAGALVAVCFVLALVGVAVN